MNESHNEWTREKVHVSFRKSSSTNGAEGWDVDVYEGATAEEAQRVFGLAVMLRRKAQEELRGPSLEEQLEISIQAEIDRVMLEDVPLP